MILISRIVLLLSVTLLFAMVLLPDATAQADISEAEESCSCICADYLGEKDVQACQVQCSTG
jgi:hypothetical protein